jgi:hypothetical protein
MGDVEADHYRWVALTNTTMAVFMSSLDGSIVLIALPAIFNHAADQSRPHARPRRHRPAEGDRLRLSRACRAGR